MLSVERPFLIRRTGDLFSQTSKIFTVSELTRQIRGTLETKFGGVWVQGEISNYKLHPSGHQYFTLRDRRAQIACVIWRDTIAPPRQPLVDGTQVQVYGTVTVFEARGQYQLNVQILQPRGIGLLPDNTISRSQRDRGLGLQGVHLMARCSNAIRRSTSSSYLSAAFNSEAASFWKRGSFRSGLNIGSRRSREQAAEVVRKVFALLFRRERLNDFLKARIATKRVPEGQQF